MVVTGTGRVSAAPDMARVVFGVEVTAPTADRALRGASKRIAEALAILERFGIAPADVQTRSVALNPRYAQRSGGNPLKVVGFAASNTLSVTVRDLGRLGAVLDAVVKGGANRIHAISFSLADPAEQAAAARRAAVADAMARARTLADAAGVRLGPILEIAEQGGQAPVVPVRARAEFAAAEVPIAEGEVTVSATVTLRFRLLE